ncbi:MAG: ankyrin repeat domain-containing protein, partial [Cyanobacteria bacterium]|nr:ankyrin repeat domain-containing protein [Cyanobacteriota bacterium]
NEERPLNTPILSQNHLPLPRVTTPVSEIPPRQSHPIGSTSTTILSPVNALHFSGLFSKTPEQKLRAAAALGDNNAFVKILKETRIENLNINQPDAYGHTPLTLATRGGHFEFVKTLLELRAKVNLQESGVENDTALILGASRGHTDIVEALIEAKADLDLKDSHGNTAILCAAREGHMGTVKSLIKAGANINLPNKQGNTPLIMAIDRGHEEIAELLFQSKALLDHQNKRGQTALTIAALENSIKLVRLLIEAKVNLDVREDHVEGDTALILASSKGHTEVVRALVKAGANTRLVDNGGRTALNCAIRDQNPEVENILRMAMQEPVPQAPKEYEEELMKALKTGSPDALIALLENKTKQGRGNLYGEATRDVEEFITHGEKLLGILRDLSTHQAP